MKHRSYRRTGLLLAVLLLLAAGLHATTVAREPSTLQQLDLLIDIRHELASSYVEQPDERAMIEAGVRGMIDSLDDPYTVYLSPEDLEPFEKQVTGKFSGIGAEIDIFEDRLRIVSPLEDSPAWKSGIMAGDIVLEIEGEDTLGIKITDAVAKLTGEPNTDVTVKVRHASGEVETITITRAVITVHTVRGFQRVGDGKYDFMLDDANRIGYIRVTQFTDQTAPEMQEALAKLVKQDVQGLVLDLRFNPGGLLEAAVDVSDMFLTDGKRIVSVRGRAVPERASDATADTLLPDAPVVVLANEASASAAEIVTGALAENGRAFFVGGRTFGKGSVQQVRMLESGLGAIKITNAYYYLPTGRNIHRRGDAEVWGVDPSDGGYVSLTPEQTRELIKVRRDADILRRQNGDGAGPEVTPEWITDELKDPQLAAGLKALQGKLKGGDWPAVGASATAEVVRKTRREILQRRHDLIQERLEELEQEIAKLDAPDDADTPEGEPTSDAESPAETPEPVGATD